MSDKDKSEIKIETEFYGANFACPECGEPLWVFIPTGDGKPEVVRARDMLSEDADTNDISSVDVEEEDSHE